MKHWTLDDIPWERFDRSRVDPEVVKIVKAAAMVEANGGDYARYLCNVFHDDPEFQEVANEWAMEEVQHGMALAEGAARAVLAAQANAISGFGQTGQGQCFAGRPIQRSIAPGHLATPFEKSLDLWMRMKIARQSRLDL